MKSAPRYAPASPLSPTQLSMRLLKNLGYVCEITEVFILHPPNKDEDAGWEAPTWGSGYRKDLFGFLDIVAAKDNVTLGVQTTSVGNISARVRKIQCSPWFEWLKRTNHWRIEVHGWDLETRNGAVKVIDMTARGEDGKFVYLTDWSSVVPKGRRSKSRLATQTQLKL